jgi:hypothetical protein
MTGNPVFCAGRRHQILFFFVIIFEDPYRWIANSGAIKNPHILAQTKRVGGHHLSSYREDPISIAYMSIFAENPDEQNYSIEDAGSRILYYSGNASDLST